MLLCAADCGIRLQRIDRNYDVNFVRLHAFQINASAAVVVAAGDSDENYDVLQFCDAWSKTKSDQGKNAIWDKKVSRVIIINR